MKCLLVILLTCLSLQAERPVSFISLFYDAKRLEESGKKTEAVAVYRRSLAMALEAHNADYAASSGMKAAYILFNQNKIVESGELCREVLEGLQPLEPNGKHGDAMRRVQLFGLMERGLFREGKIGRGWQANRAAAETLRGVKVPAGGDGPPVNLGDFEKTPKNLQSFVWRLIEREANYRDLTGDSQGARELLEKAARRAKDNWNGLGRYERFYAFKVRTSYAAQLDFLGYQAEALEIQEELLQKASAGVSAASRMNLRLNILRNRSQWAGPSEGIMVEAREVVRRMQAAEVNPLGVGRLLAKMELDLKESENAMATLVQTVKDHEGKGEWFEAAYARRDRLVALTDLNESGLDDQFIDVLQRMRSQGNKRGEPTIYAEYARYLKKQERFGEAIEMYREALRLVRIFDRTLHEIPYLCSLAHCYLAIGDTGSARAVFEELDALVAAHPEIPAQRLIRIEFSRARFLVAIGEKVPAQKAFARARMLGEGLPEWQLRWVTPEMEEAVLALEPLKASPAGAAAVRFQPREVVSVSLPSRTGLSRFVLGNLGASAAPGTLRAVGPGAQWDEKAGFHFQSGGEERIVNRAMTLQAGEEIQVRASAQSAENVEETKARFFWVDGTGAILQETAWTVAWDPESRSNIVLDAALLDANPFRAVTFVHHLAAPAGSEEAIPFRIVSPQEIRIEYYEGDGGELLAIDDNGNGDFSEAGDFHFLGPGRAGAAFVPVSLKGEISLVEIRLFAAGGEFFPLDVGGTILEAQTHDGKDWRTESENVLR